MSESEVGPLETGGMAYAPVGIGGWLILPIVHLVVNAGMILYEFISEFMKGYSEVAHSAGTGSKTDGLTLGLECSIAFALYSLFIVFYALYCLARFLEKKRSVPRLMITFYVMLLIMVGTNCFLLVQFPELNQSPTDLGNAIMGIVRVVIAVAIWIPYFVVSVRVKNTFVR
jgi:hypothetical protein